MHTHKHVFPGSVHWGGLGVGVPQQWWTCLHVLCWATPADPRIGCFFHGYRYLRLVCDSFPCFDADEEKLFSLYWSIINKVKCKVGVQTWCFEGASFYGAWRLPWKVGNVSASSQLRTLGSERGNDLSMATGQWEVEQMEIRALCSDTLNIGQQGQGERWESFRVGMRDPGPEWDTRGRTWQDRAGNTELMPES